MTTKQANYIDSEAVSVITYKKRKKPRKHYVDSAYLSLCSSSILDWTGGMTLTFICVFPTNPTRPHSPICIHRCVCVCACVRVYANS